MAQITGTAGSDNLTGTALNDVMTGGLGNDTLNGGAGNDVFIETNLNGSDVINGGVGIDTVNYRDTLNTAPLTVNGVSGQAVRSGQTDTLISVETVIATLAANDTFSAASDTDGVNINMLTGKITGLASSITTISLFENIIGGSGNDSLTGSNIANSIDAGAGNDTLYSAGGADTLIGGTGVDQFVALAAVTFNGDTNTAAFKNVQGTLTGFETIIGSTTPGDIYQALSDTDGFSINLTTGIVSGVAGGIVSVQQFEHINGGIGNDTLVGDAKVNRLFGNSGSDTISGGAGNDVLNGGAGSDTVNGDAGNDIFYETLGNGLDTLNGGIGTDSVTYDDNLSTAPLTFTDHTGIVSRGGQNDRLISIESLTATDTLTDTYDASGNTGTMSINLITGSVTGALSGLTALKQFEHVTGSSGSDTIHGSGVANGLIGGSGDDNLDGGAGNDTLEGGVGWDTLKGGIGNDVLNGAHGSDFYLYAGGGQDTIIDAEGNADSLTIAGYKSTQVQQWSVVDSNSDGFYDSLVIKFSVTNGITLQNFFDNTSNNTTTLYAGAGYIESFKFYDIKTTYQVSAPAPPPPAPVPAPPAVTPLPPGPTPALPAPSPSANVIQGTSLDDSLYGTVNNDYIYGYEGADYIKGGAGNDTIDGGFGKPDWNLEHYTFIYGEEGNDIIAAGAFADQYRVFIDGGSGNDIIIGGNTEQDFNSGPLTQSIELLGRDGDDVIYTGKYGYYSVFDGAGNDVIYINTPRDAGVYTELQSGNDYYSLSDSSFAQFNLIYHWGHDIIDANGNTIQLLSMEWVNTNLTINLNTSAGDEVTDGMNTLNWLDTVVNDITSGAGNDKITGNDVRNEINGACGHDTLMAGAGDDLLIDNSFDDYSTGVYPDFVVPERGNDSLLGGVGNDTYQFNIIKNIGNGQDIIHDISGSTDTMRLTYHTNAVTSWAAVDSLSDADAFVDTLVMRFSLDNSITIQNYFSNTSLDDDASAAGTGCIETIAFSDVTLSFAQVQGLIF